MLNELYKPFNNSFREYMEEYEEVFNDFAVKVQEALDGAVKEIVFGDENDLLCRDKIEIYLYRPVQVDIKYIYDLIPDDNIIHADIFLYIPQAKFH